MASEDLSIFLGHIGHNISLSIGERILAWFGALPLLSVFWYDLTELLGIVDNGHVGSIVGRVALIDSCTKVLEAGRDSKAIQLS